jgi:hypothetical protein
MGNRTARLLILGARRVRMNVVLLGYPRPMSAEPVPDPDLETTVRHVLPQKIDAVAYGLSVMHHDVREIRRTVADHSLRLADLAEGQSSLAEGQAVLTEGQRKQGEQLAELRRSVAEGQSTLAEGQATLAEGQAVLVEGQHRQGEDLAALRESVAEALRRLPDPRAPGGTGTSQ